MVRSAFNNVMAMFASELPEPLRQPIVRMVRELCEPDPKKRGHPAERRGNEPGYSLQRYISELEADTWTFSLNGDWRMAFQSSLGWLDVEPFSSRPAINASFLASITLGEYEKAIKIAEFGLVANPKHFVLRNNLAFALGRVGRIRDARKILETIDAGSLSDQETVTWLATSGLVSYREGRVSDGQSLYDQAIQKALAFSDKRLATKAFLFQLIEEINAQVEGAERIRQEILQKASRRSLIAPEFLPLLYHLRTFVPQRSERSLLIDKPNPNLLLRRPIVEDTFDNEILKRPTSSPFH